MKAFTILLKRLALLAVAFLAFTGCESTDGDGGNVSGGMYYGVGFYNPWYYGGYHDDDIDIIVPPNRPDRPDRPGSGARPEHPIAQPPSASTRPTPSIPSTPRAAPRGGGGGRR